MESGVKQYIAKDGTPITDEVAARWAEEAENGFANSTLTRPVFIAVIAALPS